MIAVLTGHTCGEACWMAREDVCRCSCGGKNHGILLNQSERPQRNCKIAGRRYVLQSIGDFMQIRTEMQSINDASWATRSMHIAEDRQAGTGQQNWPEVSAWIEAHDNEIPRLLWVMA